jgi:hypothetical protein
MKNRTYPAFLILWTSISLFAAALILSPAALKAQAVGTWSFGGTLAGTGTATNTVSAASLSAAITTGAFSSGVYYGEGTWPAGAIDPTYYLEFALTPNSGHTLNLSSIEMNIRRSTTGSAAGSGPNNWSVRSSLDGFTTDIATGVLSLNTSPTITVPLGASFNSLLSTITFRLYGYNATVTSPGGLNRFCYQTLTVNGLIVLPLVFQEFNAIRTTGGAVQLNWALAGEIGISAIQVERSADGINFSSIQDILPLTSGSEQQYQYVDASVSSADQNFFYRVKITENGSEVYYSEVREIAIQNKNSLSITPLPVHAGGNVELRVNADVSDNYQFYLYSINGVRVAVKSVALSNGTQFVQMNNSILHTGLYILTAERNGEKVSTKILVQ